MGDAGLLGAGRCVVAGLACFFAFDGLHHDGRRSFSFFGFDNQVTQDGVVVAERVLEFVECGLVALDVHAHIVCLDQFLDRVGQLATTPIFETVNRTLVTGNQALVALDHGGHLLALIGVHNKHYFVVTHR